jgi:parvulin-like peptidyl-prolyl isomerase
MLFVALVALAFAAALMRKRATPEPGTGLPGSSLSSPALPGSAPLGSAVPEPGASSGSGAPVGEPGPSMPAEPQEAVVGPLGESAPADAQPSMDAQLPADAPRQVGFGVVLVEYRGAQGASKAARTRAEAAAKAEQLRALADKDFAAAVKSGDKGSMDNAGSMPRGILEPGPERVLFGLRVGEVGGPVDTPRGYWVVKRLE